MHFDLAQSELAKYILSTSKEVQSEGEEKLFRIFSDLQLQYWEISIRKTPHFSLIYVETFFPSKIVTFKSTSTFENTNNHFSYLSHFLVFRGEKVHLKKVYRSIYFIYEIFVGFFRIFYMVLWNTFNVPVYSCFRWRGENCEISSCAGILEQSMGTRNRVGIGLSYRPATLGWRKRCLGIDSWAS